MFLTTAPEGCLATFRYCKEGSSIPSLQGEWLCGRWIDNPEPVGASCDLNLQAAVANRRLAKLLPTESRNHTDAHPFLVAFAIKKQSDPNFYHFNDMSYIADFRREDWQLGPGSYRVDVRITGYGMLAAKTETFRLYNEGTGLEDFCLEGPL